jgi:hypothetical protein
MRYTITIDLDNAAFFNGDGEHDPGYEVTRILNRIIERESLDRQLPEGKLYDRSGNPVGWSSITDPARTPSMTQDREAQP